MTPDQEKCMRAIERHFAKNEIAPTVHELSKALGKSKSAVHAQILALRDMGRIDFRRARARSIEILRPLNGHCPTCGHCIDPNARLA